MPQVGSRPRPTGTTRPDARSAVYRNWSAQRWTPGFVKRLSGDRQTLKPDQGTAVVEALHHLDEAVIFPADQVRCRYYHAVKVTDPAPGAPTAEIVELAGFDARQVEGDKEGTDSARTAGRCTGAGPDDRERRLGRKAGRRLLAVEDVASTVFGCPQCQVRGVRSAARLGQGDCRDHLAGGHAAQPRRDDRGSLRAGP